MSSRRLTILGGLCLLISLCISPGVEALTIIAFQSTETGTYLFTPTSATTNHAVAAGTGTGTLGAFQSSGFQDSDFTDPLHQIVSNGHFTQDYGSGTTLFGTFAGTAAATSATGGTFTLAVPFIGGTGALSDVIGGSGAATGTFEFVSANPDQSENFTYVLSLVGSVDVVPEPWSLALLISGLVVAAFFRRIVAWG